MKCLKAGNNLQAWRMALQTVVRYGVEIKDERGSKTREVEDLIIEIADPIQCPRKHFYWHGEKLERYIHQVRSPDLHGFVYTYGHRLREYFGTDQIGEAIEKLKKNQNTRRAVMVTFDPIRDNEQDEIPCILLIQFRIRKYKLNTSVFWRSNDVWGALYPNLMAISEIIKMVSDEIDVDIGTLTTHAASAHIYEINFKEVDDYIKTKRITTGR